MRRRLAGCVWLAFKVSTASQNDSLRLHAGSRTLLLLFDLQIRVFAWTAYAACYLFCCS